MLTRSAHSVERARSITDPGRTQVQSRPDRIKGVHQLSGDDGARMRVRAALLRGPGEGEGVLGSRGPVLRSAGREAGGHKRGAVGRGQGIQEGVGSRRPHHTLRAARRAVSSMPGPGEVDCLAMEFHREYLLLPQYLAVLHDQGCEAEATGRRFRWPTPISGERELETFLIVRDDKA